MSNPIKKYRVIAGLIWICTVLFSFVWNYADDIREKNAIALETARAFLTHIIAVRSWNAEHGGLLVYTDEQTPVNPYSPEGQQTVITQDGRQLTNINPAYMTRQIAEVADRQSNVRFHLTSIHPLRPENKALPWEEEWLKDFERGIMERSAFVEGEDGEVFRYMAPLRMSTACLACHDGYGEGEIRGGLSISLPLDFRKSIWPLLISHVGAMGMGLLVIQFFATRLESRRRQLQIINQHLLLEIEGHKRSEQELVKITDELESRVAGRTAELSKINALLDAKVKEQEQIEKALLASNAEFIQIFNSAPDGMRILAGDGTVLRANKAFLTLSGRDGEEIVGRKCHEIFSGRLCHTPECPLTRIFAGVPRVEVESRKVRADGGSIPCVVTATPFRAPDGTLVGIIEVTRDVSGWKEAERSLSLVAQDLLQRNQELQDFTHVISHDLQEPLMLIQAFSRRLRTHFITFLAERGKGYLERIISSADRMQLLIDGLLYYSRIDQASQPFVQVGLNAIVQNVLEDLTIKIEESHAVIEVAELGEIMADPLQMRQLFQNIIGNSLKYRHPERIPEIRIARVEVPVGRNPQSWISLSIKDNGIGFKEEYQEKIFEIFQRLHTRQQFNGTGIGLSICKKIVERHHGLISATAVFGEGAEFVVTLPVQQGLEPPAVETPAGGLTSPHEVG